MRKRPRIRPAILPGHLPGTAQHVLVRCQPFEAHRPTRMQPRRRHPNLRSQPIAEPVRKARTRIVKHTCRIHLAQKPLRTRVILGQNRIRVRGAVPVNVRDRLVQPGHNAQGQRQIAVLRMPVSHLAHNGVAHQRPRLGVAQQSHAAAREVHRKPRQQRRRNLAVEQHRLHRIARRRVVRLRIVDDAHRQLRVSTAVHKDVTHTLRMAKHRNPRVRLHIRHQRVGPARNHQVHQRA